MKNTTSSIYTGWDFKEVWTFDSTRNDGYPILQVTDNWHYVNVTINFEKGPFGYVYSHENNTLYRDHEYFS